jgi:hypothetical protein
MPHTLLPPTAADSPTIYPIAAPPRYPFEPVWQTWIPAAPWEATIPTRLLPPEKPAPPVRIPSNVPLVPTDLLPPDMLDIIGPASYAAPVPPPDLFHLLGEPAAATASAPATAPATAPASATASASATATASASVPAPALPPPLPLDEFPLSRRATILAALALRPNEAAEIFAAHRIDATTFAAIDHHFREAIFAALDRGDPSLLRAHDAAFVAEIERERGPITADRYAALQRASARGKRRDVLDALGLPAGAVLPIERVMLRRMAADSALGARVRECMAAG